MWFPSKTYGAWINVHAAFRIYSCQELPFWPADLPNAGIELESLTSPALAGRFFTTEPPVKPLITILCTFWWKEQPQTSFWLQETTAQTLENLVFSTGTSAGKSGKVQMETCRHITGHHFYAQMARNKVTTQGNQKSHKYTPSVSGLWRGRPGAHSLGQVIAMLVPWILLPCLLPCLTLGPALYPLNPNEMSKFTFLGLMSMISPATSKPFNMRS